VGSTAKGDGLLGLGDDAEERSFEFSLTSTRGGLLKSLVDFGLAAAVVVVVDDNVGRNLLRVAVKEPWNATDLRVTSEMTNKSIIIGKCFTFLPDLFNAVVVIMCVDSLRSLWIDVNDFGLL